MSNPTVPSIRYVVFHTPGPKWQHGMDFREQDGVQEHVQHYLKFHEQGKLEFGGPFLLQDRGGMTLPPPTRAAVVATKEVSQEELESFAAADPAVRSGLLLYEIRPWLTAMEHK
jgi:uncharacterized protein YciI